MPKVPRKALPRRLARVPTVLDTELPQSCHNLDIICARHKRYFGAIFFLSHSKSFRWHSGTRGVFGL
jgi:hypothetical protein